MEVKLIRSTQRPNRFLTPLFGGVMVAFLLLGSSGPVSSQDSGAVFVMTNDPQLNEVVVFERNDRGRLLESERALTGGQGSGGDIDPLKSQGSLILSADGQWLFAVNARSREISQFAVSGSAIELVELVRSRGSFPISLTQFGDQLYVLNAGGRPNIQGFEILDGGGLVPIGDSKRFLASDVAASGRAEGPVQVSFTPDGTHLVLTDRLTDEIHLYSIGPEGLPAEESVRWPSFGGGPFGFDFDPRGYLLVSELWGRNPPGTQLDGSVSSYRILETGALDNRSRAIENSQLATCWLVSDGKRHAYTTNTTSGTLSRYKVRPNGKLRVRPKNGIGFRFRGSPGAFPTDLAVTSDGRFLYTLNAGRGTVGMFRIRNSGKLVFLGEAGSLQPSSGLQGIAAR